MNDRRAAGQELQSQVLAAARKGQRRMQSTVKNVTSAAQHIRPQLANLPKPTLNLSSVPGQAHLRERAPELATKLHSRLPGTLQSRLPSPDQVKSSAQQFAVHARTLQRNVVGQVRSAAAPLAQQASARFGQVGSPVGKSETTTRVSHVSVTKGGEGKSSEGKDSKPSGSTASAKTGSSAKSGDAAKSGTSANSGNSAKPGTSAKSGTRPASSSASSAKKPRSKPTDS